MREFKPALSALSRGVLAGGLRLGLGLGLGLGLAACGARAPLQPAPGETLPVAPYGTGNGEAEAARPNAEQLLRLDALAAPERTVELRQRSEEREDDPFDLPPDGPFE